MTVSIVVPIYNLYGSRIRNLLESIRCQTIDSEVILVDYGSGNEGHQRLVDTVSPYDVSLIYVPDVEWSPPRACNIGIKKAVGDTVIKVDADLILEPKTLEDTVECTTKTSFVIRQPKFLYEDFDYENLRLPRDYPKIRQAKSEYWLPSYGGFFAAHHTWWRRVRGYDERYKWYGCNDWDLWNRAIHSGLNRWIFGEPGLKGMKGISPYRRDTFVYHQWHSDPATRLGVDKEFLEEHRDRNRQIYNNSEQVVRNSEQWGMINEH